MFLEFSSISASISVLQNSLKNPFFPQLFLCQKVKQPLWKTFVQQPIIESAIRQLCFYHTWCRHHILRCSNFAFLIYKIILISFYDSVLESLPFFVIRFKSTYEKYVLYICRTHMLWSTFFLFRTSHLVLCLWYLDLQDTVLCLDWFS